MASRYPRTHRSVQHFLSCCVLDTLTNDTMLVSQRAALHGCLDPVRALLGSQEQAAMDVDEQGGESGDDDRGDESEDEFDDEARERRAARARRASASPMEGIEQKLHYLLGRKVLLDAGDAPHNSLHFSAYSMTHSPSDQAEGRRSRRLLSVPPRVVDGYDRAAQRPPAGVSHASPDFYREVEGSDPCSTSWVFEHGREVLHQRFLKHSDDNADPFFRVWTDVPDNVQSHFARVRSELEQFYVDPWCGTKNQNPKWAVVSPDEPTTQFCERDESVRLPLHLFYQDKYCDSYRYEAQECSLADSLVYAPDRHGLGTTARSFRETAREDGLCV